MNMTSVSIGEAMAQAFTSEGVDTLFALMGTGNMYWVTAMNNIAGLNTVLVRHEHCACAMAMGYHSATRKVGVASVTCGPGFTQISTALMSALRNRIPLVILAGETPLDKKWDGQRMDQSVLAAACNAPYIAVHSPRLVYQNVRDAFYLARHERRPVVLGVPSDLQKRALPEIGAYQPSAEILPAMERMPPSRGQVDQLADRLSAAACPVIIAGRGVIASEAADEVEQLAEQSGALLATTLLARGLFDDNPFSLGIAGGYSRKVARELFAQSDLVLAIGASLNDRTADGGHLFPDAEIIQIDIEPVGLQQSSRVADIYMKADAKLAANALLERMREIGKTKASMRNATLAARIRDEPADDFGFPSEPGTVDPRQFFQELEQVLPKDFDMVSGSGHYAYFHTPMRGGDPRRYHAMREFGAIGNGLSYAVGVAAARRNGRVVLFEGDGSLIMHIQELETVLRHGLKLLIICCNDGAYGSELHKLRNEDMDDRGAVFGRPDFAKIAKGFGLRGTTITGLGGLQALMDEYESDETATIWNVHVSDRVVSPMVRRQLSREH
jgi:acetolactate synthase-1/2/3 large subunit